jgi:hypothetical protein
MTCLLTIVACRADKDDIAVTSAIRAFWTYNFADGLRDGQLPSCIYWVKPWTEPLGKHRSLGTNCTLFKGERKEKKRRGGKRGGGNKRRNEERAIGQILVSVCTVTCQQSKNLSYTNL